MSVLVDTPVWSALFRRAQPVGPEVQELRELVLQRRAILVGPVRQEVLSGIKTLAQFVAVRNALAPFPDLQIEPADYVRAAEFSDTCRAKGVRGPHTDFLLCAVARRQNALVFTTDRDFHLYAKHLPIRLYAPTAG